MIAQAQLTSISGRVETYGQYLGGVLTQKPTPSEFIQEPALYYFTKLRNRAILDHLNMIYFFTHDVGRLLQAKFFHET